MARRLLNLASLLSLLLCLAACVLWVRSYGIVGGRQFQRDGVRWRVVSEDGRLVLDNEPQRAWEMMQDRLARERYEAERRRLEGQATADYKQGVAAGASPSEALDILRRASDQSRRDAAGFGPWGGPRARTPLYRRSVHFALLTGVTALLPAALLIRAAHGWHRRRTRRRSGLCPDCGYDLRATSGRCPECGSPAPA